MNEGISYEELQRIKAGILKLAEIEEVEPTPLSTGNLKRSVELSPDVQRWIDDQYMDLGKMVGWRVRLRGKWLGWWARLRNWLIERRYDTEEEEQY